jgi:hypothetical protein
MKVSNMIGRSGRPVANQFTIDGGGGRLFFQSYESVIARKYLGLITLDKKYWDYSRTTLKYLGRFLNDTVGMGKSEIQSRIDSGEYKLANLN